MNEHDLRRWRLIAIGAALALVTGSALAAGYSDARTGIQATIDNVNLLQQRNAPANEIAGALFEDDLMITGEGESRSYRDLASFMDTFTRLSSADMHCDLRLVDPIRTSGKLAAAFVTQHCAAANAGDNSEVSRVLFVFRKGVKGWRVTMGHWSTGTF